jgi:hypothetical protein
MVTSLIVDNYKSSPNNFLAAWCLSVPLEQRRMLQIEVVKAPSLVCASSEFQTVLSVINNSELRISSRDPFPIHISYHWINRSTGETAVFDGKRTKIHPELLMGQKVEKHVAVISPNNAGEYILRLTFVQEGVAWFDADGADVFADIGIVVH